MPEIMRQFGQTIVVAVAGGLIFAMLFSMWPSGGSVLDDLGSRASTPLNERTVTGAGTAGFDQHSSRSLPGVVVNSQATQGVAFPLTDKFTITAADGGVWSRADGGFILDGVNRGGLVQIESIVSSDGTEHVGGLIGDHHTAKVELSQATGTVKFLAAGVYRIRLRVMDQDNVEAFYTFPLVVDFVLND